MVNDRPADSFTAARRAMIDSQLRVSGVNDEVVLNAINAVAREAHVPADALALAYIDRAVPLADGRFLAAPLFYGRLLTEATPRANDTILVVDGGSGYLPALARRFGATVDVVDAAAAGTATGTYTLLLIDGAVEEIPAALADRLADNARIGTGLVERNVTRLAVGTKSAGDVALLTVVEMGIPTLPAFAKAKGWSF